jgi:hypothetical protein
MATQLHIYRAPADERHEAVETDDDVDTLKMPSVRVRLGDLLPLVAMAQKLNFIWLKDFLDDDVRISEDLHEVLLTLRAGRPSA